MFEVNNYLFTCRNVILVILLRPIVNFLTILKYFKTQHLIQCQFLPEDQIIPVIDNEMDKSDQLACIYIKSHYEQKMFCYPYVFSTAKVKTKSNQAVLGL